MKIETKQKLTTIILVVGLTLSIITLIKKTEVIND